MHGSEAIKIICPSPNTDGHFLMFTLNAELLTLIQIPTLKKNNLFSKTMGYNTIIYSKKNSRAFATKEFTKILKKIQLDH